MKKNRFIKSALLIITVFSMLTLSLMPAFARENRLTFRVGSEQPSVRQATEIPLDAELLDLLTETLLNTQTEVIVEDLQIPFSPEYTHAVCNYLYDCVPEAFHLSNIYYSNYTDGEFYAFYFEYSCSAEEFAVKTAEYEKVAQKLLSGIKGNNKLTDVEKALLLHDRLALHCEYGDMYADTSETSNVYAALVGRKPVCQGYAEAYLYLLGQVGIQSEIVSSDTLYHSWNIVYIDNQPYHVDVTWDDPTSDVYGRVLHNNFLLSTTALQTGVNGSRGHNATDFKSTPVSTTYDNYYWQNSEAAFQLIDNEIYYIDNTQEELRRTSDHAKICSVKSKWTLNSEGSWLVSSGRTNFAKLACVNNTLYCSLPTAIYTVDTTTGQMTEFIKPELKIDGETFYSIRGFALEGNTLYLDYCNLNNQTIKTAKTQITVSVPEPEPEPDPITKGDINMDGNIDAGDARMALRASVGLETLSESAFTAADVNNDSIVDAGDARAILRYSVGIGDFTD